MIYDNLTKETIFMIIFSQDRKTVMDCSVLTVDRSFGGGKDAKYAILGRTGESVVTVMAAYPEEKNAVDALEKAYDAFAEGASSYKF